MNEAQRQFALGVAGVRLWYARTLLPGAAPSPDLDFPEPPPEPTVAPTAAVTSPSGRGSGSRNGLAHLQELLAETQDEQTASPVRVGSEPPQPAVSRAIAEPESAPITSRTAEPEAGTPGLPGSDPAPVADGLKGQAVEFHWCFWVGKEWVLVSARSDAASRTLEDSLARNILKVLSDTAEQFEEVHWPVFANPAVPGNDAASAADLLAEVAGSLGGRRRVCLGLVPDEAREGELLFSALMASLGEVAVQSPVSLAALASDSAAKRDLWQALKTAVRI